jgi:hypothetical protein
MLMVKKILPTWLMPEQIFLIVIHLESEDVNIPLAALVTMTV